MLPDTPSPESRRAVDDGYLWPFARQDMRERGPIIERMVEDIERLIHHGGDTAVVTQDDLVRKGWTLAQLEEYGALAFAYHRAEYCPRRPRHATTRRHIARAMAVDAAVLTVFVCPVLFWAGRFAGAL